MTNIQTLANAHKWNLPTVCPVCGGELVLSDNHCQLKCSNEFCKSKMSGRIAKWTSTIGAKEFGLKTIEVLIDNENIPMDQHASKDIIRSIKNRLIEGCAMCSFCALCVIC